ncbi:MAG: SAM-dependent chlorinase/fluorinase [Candidatus Aminicenantes bacterium]|jgi:hypothetical protein
MRRSIIALTTDFGEDDFFVPSLKGVIASINPSARVFDVTHNIPSFDVLAGSFVLFAAYRYFPKKTIFLTVVDPGVGSNRKILLVETKRYFFIAPDNGVLSLALGEEEVSQIRDVSNPKYFLRQKGVTFEGRDRMAPVSAWLSHGIFPEEFGPEVTRYKKIRMSKPVEKADEILGVVLYRDKFGNLITNIPVQLIESYLSRHPKTALQMIVGDKIIMLGESYSDVQRGEPVFLFGSLGLVEIAVREGSASKRLNITPKQALKFKMIK